MRSLLVLMMVFSMWATIHAQTKNYTLLEPLPGTTIEDATKCPPTGCTTNFETYLPGLFNWAIGVAAVMAFVMITAGGIMYMTADSIGGTTKGRGMIENAIWGLMLVIASYVILYTINPAILSFKLEIPGVTIASSTPNGIVANLPSEQFLQANALVVRQYENNGIRVNNKTACPQEYTRGVQQIGCTTLYGLPSSVLTGLTQLKSCNCNLIVTGGSEYHGEGVNQSEIHKLGNAVVDLYPDAKLYDYLREYGSYRNRSNGHMIARPDDGMRIDVKLAGSRAEFTYEINGSGGLSTGDHWHVVFK